ncbi:MAG: flagellar motor protein [Myxococcota bacterium]
MDLTTIAGILVGVSCIVLGQLMEGGNVASLAVGAAAVIVLGGTAGAVLISFPASDLRRALRQIRNVIAIRNEPTGPLIPRIVGIARKCRREGLLVLEAEAKQTRDPFLRQALLALVDGNDVEAMRALLNQVIDQQEQFQEPGVLLFETAGAFAPTIGILGAVIGLIQVMENLADPSSLGSGIAVAFVATVYGVGSANLLFLPSASKLRLKIQEERRRREMIVEGLCSIQEGLNPHHIEKRLQIFLEDHGEAA